MIFLVCVGIFFQRPFWRIVVSDKRNSTGTQRGLWFAGRIPAIGGRRREHGREMPAEGPRVRSRGFQPVHCNSQHLLPLPFQEIGFPLNAFPGEDLLNVRAHRCLVVENIRRVRACRCIQLSQIVHMRGFEQNLDGLLQLLRLIFVGGQR